MQRSITISGAAHDVAEALPALLITAWFVLSGWPAIVGALIASPGVPLIKLGKHRFREAGVVPLRKHLEDLGWECLVWGTGWLPIIAMKTGRDPWGIDGLAILIPWYLALWFVRYHFKIGRP